MEAGEKIRQALREIAKREGPATTLLGTVTSVDKAKATCDIWDEDSQTTSADVRLNPVDQNTYGYRMIPKLNTWALAVRVEDTEDWMLIHAQEIEEIKINSDKIIFNEGSRGGLVNWPDCKTELNKLKEFMNAVKQACSTPALEPGNGAASVFQTILNSAISALLPPNFEGKEDTKVKH